MRRKLLGTLCALGPILSLIGCHSSGSTNATPPTGAVPMTGNEAPTKNAEGEGATDAQLKQTVEAKLKADTDLKDAKIQVEVSNGQVELTGKVKTQEQSTKANDIAVEATKSSPDAGVLNQLTMEP